MAEESKNAVLRALRNVIYVIDNVPWEQPAQIIRPEIVKLIDKTINLK